MESAGLQGENADGERVVFPFFDTPIQIASRFPSKEALERAQLEKYRLDYLLRFGEVPFEGVERGGDPPDFLVRRGGLQHGIDCAALALEEKRGAEALFRKLVHKVAANDIASLGHLAGTEIGIWFKSDASDIGPGLPPRAADDAAAQKLVEGLENFRLDRQRIAEITADIAAHRFPQNLPDEVSPVEKEEFGFHVTPVDSWQPRDPLTARLGFSISLTYALPIEGRSVQPEIQRLVSAHDKEGIDQLLLVIGGPNIDGIRFPAEHYLSLWLKKDRVEPVSARNLRQATAHSWIDGELFDMPVRTP
jgi:hypothetical protein